MKEILAEMLCRFENFICNLWMLLGYLWDSKTPSF